MAAFEYQALKGERTTRGVLHADSARQARSRLRERGLVPLEVAPVRASERSGWLRDAGRERALVLRQMSALVRSGLPLEEVLAIIAEQAETPRTRSPLAAMRAGVVEGRPLSDVMAEQPVLFPVLYSRSVAAGERAGRLETVLERLAGHAEASRDLRRGLGVAMVYPILLVLVSLTVVWGLIGFVVPRVVGVFAETGAELPLLTRSLLAVSGALERGGPWLLAAIVLGIAGCWWVLRSPAIRQGLDGWLLRAPLVGRLVRARLSATFARTLAILVSSAVPLVESLNVAAGVVGNRVAADSIRTAADRVREGAQVSRALAEVDWLPATTRRLIAGGERAGDLAPMLDQAAAIQEAQLADTVSMLLAVLQPILILLVGLLVLYIVLAILLPIMNLSQLLG